MTREAWHDVLVEQVDGFVHQRMHVVERARVTEALRRPVTRRLVVTDAGFFPAARFHARARPHGVAETILIVCVSGSGWVEVAGVRTGVGAGAVAVIPGGVPHRYEASEAAPWTIWWCHLRGTDVAELVAATGLTLERPVATLRHPERAVALLEEMVTTLERSVAAAQLVGAAGCAWKLLTQVAVDRAMPERGDPLGRAMRYIDERFDGSIRVADLAAMVGVSASHLSALFRGATGAGVLAYVTSRRMAAARQLLDSTSMRIADVAAAVGYPDPLYFSRQFRKAHEMSPSEYRELRKG
ncbi:AraC family transcriptional regulator [Demequina phytophila]|uniref:AraC family transcriptional regulator n=1 Tax=Demequina phytophila TaxID=1638981 RepID=UPI000A44FFA1|nr:AraC family transcriptional regulator [Demequina phytophila]